MMNREFDLQIDPAHPALPGHFPGNPIVPAVVILTELEATIREALGHSAELIGLPSVKFVSPLRPGELCRIVLSPSGSVDFRFTVTSGERTIVTGMAHCGPAGRGT
jgi:3-hydroxyacyl-[acyl-carrier-protein] dehydratase